MVHCLTSEKNCNSWGELAPTCAEADVSAKLYTVHRTVSFTILPLLQCFTRTFEDCEFLLSIRYYSYSRNHQLEGSSPHFGEALRLISVKVIIFLFTSDISTSRASKKISNSVSEFWTYPSWVCFCLQMRQLIPTSCCTGIVLPSWTSALQNSWPHLNFHYQVVNSTC